MPEYEADETNEQTVEPMSLVDRWAEDEDGFEVVEE
jgi:hypothetical protein